MSQKNMGFRRMTHGLIYSKLSSNANHICSSIYLKTTLFVKTIIIKNNTNSELDGIHAMLSLIGLKYQEEARLGQFL